MPVYLYKLYLHSVFFYGTDIHLRELVLTVAIHSFIGFLKTTDSFYQQLQTIKLKLFDCMREDLGNYFSLTEQPAVKI